MIYYSSRILNEHSGFLGLSVIDMIVLTAILVIAHECVDLLSFPITGVAAFALVGVRLRSRPKTIRDFVTYYLQGRVL